MAKIEAIFLSLDKNILGTFCFRSKCLTKKLVEPLNALCGWLALLSAPPRVRERIALQLWLDGNARKELLSLSISFLSEKVLENSLNEIEERIQL